MKKMVLVDPKRCTGCRTCEMVCSFTNEQVFSHRKARILISETWGWPFSPR